MRIVFLTLLLVGCGTGGDPGSGDENLPNPGFAPYTVLLDSDGRSRSLFPEEAGLGGPFAYATGERVVLYLHQCIESEPCRILRSESPDGTSFGPLQTVSSDPRGLIDPFVSRETGTTRLWALTTDGQRLIELDPNNGSILREVSSPPGAPLISPSVQLGPDGLEVISLNRANPGQIVRWNVEPDGEFQDIQLCASAPCSGSRTIHDVEIRKGATVAGRTVWRALFSYDDDSGTRVLGAAASHDGHSWSAFAFNPTVLGNGDLRSGTQIRFGDRYLIYAESGRSTTRIVVAINDRPQASHRW